MHPTPAATVRALLAAFAALGLDTAALRRAADLGDEEATPAADDHLPAEVHGLLWREALRQRPGEELPTEAGLVVPFGAFGALDHLAGSSPTVESSFRSLQSYLGDAGGDLELAMRARLRSLLAEGRADAGSVARLLGVSVRTLHRRLQAQGRTFQGVLDAFREAEAERLLGAGRCGLSEVAARLGFSDQTAWNRAFRRWKGKSPTAWLQARSGAAGPSRRR